MGSQHVSAQFSEAFDGVLSGPERRRFDAHLAACDVCSAAFVRYAAAVDSVRTLAPARMPVAVRLPVGDPRAARERGGLIAALRAAASRPRALGAMGVVTACAAAAVVAVVALHGQSSSGTGSIAARSGAEQGAGGPQAALAAPAAPTQVPGFPNAATLSVPGRPGATLLLATAASQYTPGSTVTILARLTDPQGASLPDVRVGVEKAAAAGDAVAGQPAFAPTAGAARGSALSPLSVVPIPFPPALTLPAHAAFGAAAGSSHAPYEPIPLLQVVIPAGLQPGDRVVVVASAPQGGSGTPVSVVLTLTIL